MSSRRAKAARRAAQAQAPPNRKASHKAKRPVATGRKPTSARPAARPGSRRGARRAPKARPAWKRIEALWRSISRTGPLAAPERPAVLSPLVRRDFLWAAGTGALAAALFATIITGHPALSDAAESVAGVSSLGILHAPGYPAYVIAAKLFSLLVPVGGEALRVNLFSLFCAALSIGGVQLLGRRCGAPRWACSLGALTLAASAGFWFYAGFAKHDMFSGLIFLIALHLALAWRARPSLRRLIALGVVFGIGLGSSWPLMVMLAPTVAFVLLSGRRELSIRSALCAAAAGAGVVIALGGFVMVRAAQNPAVNFDDVTSIGRLVELATRADFTAHSIRVQPSNSSGGGSAAPHASVPAASRQPAAAITLAQVGLTTKLSNYLVVFAREFGVLGLVLAALGLLVSLRRRLSAASYPLLITFGVNLLGAAAVVGIGGTVNYDADLVEEGFLLGCLFVLSVWLALGATELVAGVTAGGRRLAGRLTVGYRRGAVEGVAVCALGAALLVPSVIGHWDVAHRAAKPYADRLASTVFSELPPHAAIFLSNGELADPLIYQQVVAHKRRDVLVVDMYALSYDWYRDLITRQLGSAPPPLVGDSVLNARRAAKWLSGVRPVYLDPHAAQVLAGTDPYASHVPGDVIAYQPAGIVARLVPRPTPVPFPSVLDASFRRAEQSAGMPDPNWNVWPNALVAQIFYQTAALEVARAYYEHHDTVGMRQALLNELSINPGDPVAQKDLQLLSSSGAG